MVEIQGHAITPIGNDGRRVTLSIQDAASLALRGDAHDDEGYDEKGQMLIRNLASITGLYSAYALAGNSKQLWLKKRPFQFWTSGMRVFIR